MDWLQTGLIVGSLLSATAAFIWVALNLANGGGGGKKDPQGQDDLAEAAKQDVERVFNDEFREELRNRGRLHFEKIIGENAMFLQQDLRLTTSEVNEYMKGEITKSLEEAFKKYEASITDAKQLALDSIQKTQAAVEQQRQMMNEQLVKEIAVERERSITRFNENMADIVNHYVLAAIGNQINLEDQLEYILGELERNKKDIIEDINFGA
jgi:F0F1-type ATP synthase membrane subunit b/b'